LTLFELVRSSVELIGRLDQHSDCTFVLHGSGKLSKAPRFQTQFRYFVVHPTQANG
jgi:hypothetical protein